MLNFFKPKAKPLPIPTPNATVGIREVLFGDMPIEQWPAPNNSAADVIPWSLFVDARNHITSGQTASAVETLRKIVDTPELEPRQYVQAWTFLRKLGTEPEPEIAKKLYGTVIEVGMPTGFDLLAAYSDKTARYMNYSASGVIWEHPNDSLDPTIDALLTASERVVAVIGPWHDARRPAPANNIVRVNFLTPSGLHFGEAPMATLMSDPLSSPVLHNGIALMTKLIEISEANR